MAHNRYSDDRYLTPQPGAEHHPQFDDDDDDEGAGKTEEFERFMATSIRAFDAMMDAVKVGGDGLVPTAPYSHHRSASRPTSRPSSRPSSRPASPHGNRHGSVGSERQQLRGGLAGLTESDSVAIVGNEYMVSEVRQL